MSTTASRQKAVKAALGSVRAEGLKPSKAIQRDLNEFARGKTTLDSIRDKTILRAHGSRSTAK